MFSIKRLQNPKMFTWNRGRREKGGSQEVRSYSTLGYVTEGGDSGSLFFVGTCLQVVGHYFETCNFFGNFLETFLKFVGHWWSTSLNVRNTYLK